MRLVLRMLTAVMSEQILRLVETGIENTNSCYVTVNIVAIGIGIKNVNSCYVTVDIEAIETGIENANSCYVRADVEDC